LNVKVCAAATNGTQAINPLQGEKRYWLHIALGSDLIQANGILCTPGQTGCQVDLLGSQLEEVVE
jgi:hypothetical protein